MPDAPVTWICGDCHVGNIGLVADEDGRTTVAIRDLDQGMRSHPAYDVCRLALSLAVLARSSDLPGLATCHLLESLLDGYTAAFPHTPETAPVLPPILSFELRKAQRRRWQQLVRERTEGETAALPLSSHFWPLTSWEREQLHTLLGRSALRAVAACAVHRESEDPVVVLDAAYWRKGCSSLGYLRYAALLDIGGEARAGHDACLIDIKEAVPSFAPHLAEVPVNHAQRIVEAARALSPALGQRMLAGEVGGRPVFVRELLPQDTRVDVQRLSPRRARRLAAYLGYVLGVSHARQMHRADRRAWCRTLRRSSNRALGCPSWLWQNTTGLLADLEVAYLEHCRQYMDNAGV